MLTADDLLFLLFVGWCFAFSLFALRLVDWAGLVRSSLWWFVLIVLAVLFFLAALVCGVCVVVALGRLVVR